MHDAIPLLVDYLHDAACRLPTQIALVCGQRRVSFAELEASSNALAHTLIARGLERGDRVVIFADNTVESVVSFWAVLKASGVVSVVNPLTKADKLAYLLNDCRATALITDSHLKRVFAEALETTKHVRTVIMSGRGAAAVVSSLPNGISFEDAIGAGEPGAPPARRNIDIDLAAIIYTSGSTGEPKGVMLTHRNMLTAATSVSTYLGYAEDDIVLSALPLSFDYGLYQMVMCVRQGARLVLERSFTYPREVLKLVQAEQCTVFPLVPTMAAIIAEMELSAFDFSTIRSVTNTAAALTQKHIDIIRSVFSAARIFSMYGLTECKRCTYLPPEDIDKKPGSVGIAIPNTEVWVEDEAGERVPPGTVGELVVRGATVMKGYWEKPEATAKRLKPGPLPGEFVLHTGDYCRQDSDGYVYFVGRRDDIIKSRGEKVAPKEVETQISLIPGVKECAVIGVPDDVLGQAVKAFVVLERGATLTEKEIQGEALLRMENFMAPKYVVLVPDLPKTTTGKIKKTELA